MRWLKKKASSIKRPPGPITIQINWENVTIDADWGRLFPKDRGCDIYMNNTLVGAVSKGDNDWTCPDGMHFSTGEAAAVHWIERVMRSRLNAIDVEIRFDRDKR